MVTLPKQYGGLQIKNIRLQNLALLTDGAWRFLSNYEKHPWLKLLKNKYLPNTQALATCSPKLKSGTSVVWKA